MKRGALCIAALGACAWSRGGGAIDIDAHGDAAGMADASIADAPIADARVMIDAREIDAPPPPDAAQYAPVAWGPLTGSFDGLDAFVHVPAGMEQGVPRPLIVVLHGCWEDAKTHETNAQWDAFADVHHLYVLHAQDAQQVQQCFDWWSLASQQGDGDAAGVLAMVDAIEAQYSIDTSHVYLDGFSSGGALAVILCAIAPQRFAGAIVHAGLPYKGYTGTDVGTLGYIFTEHDQTPQQRAAVMPGSGPYPTILAFVGASDTTVHPTFTRELVDQWTRAQGADQIADLTGTLKPGNTHHTYREYRDASSRLIIATVTIDGMDHGYAVDPNGTGADKGGATSGAFNGHPSYGKDVALWSTYWGAAALGIP
ncbi:MAG TPA: PHB depolymerase family esterase [Kofleriaceae bacterium]|nr:PHB depolymerase family esterase [Kofleriaceae bacterium]